MTRVRIADDIAGLAVPLDRLSLLEGNPRRGDVAAVARSYRRFGQRKPIVARVTGDRDGGRVGVVVAGNHQLAAARQLGWDSIAVVWVSDDEDTARAFALADNRTADLGTYDEAALGEMLEAVKLVDDDELFAATGFTDDDLAELLGVDGGDDGGGAGDEVPPVLEVAVSKPGDVWLLGPHRVVCGDALDPVVQDAAVGGQPVGCVLTDPPYGMNLDTDWSSLKGSEGHRTDGGGTYRPVEGDGASYDAGPLRERFAAVREQFWFGADYYRSTLSEDDRDGSWLVWDKRLTEEGDRVVGSGFELVWSSQPHKRDLLRALWAGHYGTAGEDIARAHPTQKPTKLLAAILDRWAPAGCVVADFYGGSGSTLIAAHKTGRTACLVELDPLYVDVICRRWQEFAGDKPTLESTGQPHDFTTDG